MLTNMMANVLQLAINKAVALPEEAQEQIGREILERIDTLEQLRSEIAIGIDDLDSGGGQELDIEAFIKEIHAEHAKG